MTTTSPAPSLSWAGPTARGSVAMAMVGSSVGVSATLVDAPLLTAQAVRYAAAGLLLLALARRAGARIPRPCGREWLWLAGVAGTGLVLFNVAIVRGVEHAEPAAVAVAVACAPVLIGLLGPLLEGRIPQGRVVAAAVVVTAGSALVEGAGRADAAGVTWAGVALLCEAGFTLLAVPVLPRLSPWGVSVHAVWIATLMLLGAGLVVDGPGAVVRLDLADLLAIGYLAVVVTAFAFVLWYGAVASLGSARAALLCGVAPVAAAVVGIATTGDVPGPLVWLGVAVVLGGLALGIGGRHRGVLALPVELPAEPPAEPSAGTTAWGASSPGRAASPSSGPAAGPASRCG